jgi:monoamine oxidase
MEAQIKHKSTHYQRAVAVRETDDGASLTVTFDHGHNPRPASATRTEKKYSNVISTMSLGCLRMVDLDQIYLSDGQRNALRELAYGPSIKVGIQFKSAWWEKLGIIGGQSSSDLPIRDIIYPSYGPDVSRPNNAKSTCLIASYNGMQDAQRLGGLMKGRDTPEERVLLDLVMRDLAKVHNKDVKEIWDEFEDYFPYDHYRDEFKLGKYCCANP